MVTSMLLMVTKRLERGADVETGRAATAADALHVTLASRVGRRHGGARIRFHTESLMTSLNRRYPSIPVLVWTPLRMTTCAARRGCGQRETRRPRRGCACAKVSACAAKSRVSVRSTK